jgi:TetR/AcrR family transcriptional regulator of autoinduction and epiphytic fitness
MYGIVIMAKKPNRGDAKRDTILDAATRAFRDEGYETTSMDRIAELAGASKRTVYNHFGSKEALFSAVVEHLVSQMVDAKKIDWDPDRPIEDQLAEFARAKGGVAENPAWLGLLRVVLGVFIRHPELAKETMAQAEASECHLVRWLEAARDAGRLRIKDVQLASKIFWALASGALFWPAVFEGPISAEDRARITRELVETFLSRYGR